jgi:hypothetical protein
VERQLRGLADRVTNPLRVLLARQLDRDAVGADALDRRLGHAKLVEAPCGRSRDSARSPCSPRWVMLASVGVTVMTVSDAAATVMSGAPSPNGPIGVARPRNSVIACSRDAASLSVIVTTLLSRRTDCGWIRACRSTRTASAFSVCSRSR